MLRRTLTFIAAILLIGAVSSLVYFNSQPTTLQFGPRQEVTVPLAWLIVGSTLAGASLVLALLLAREGHWALRQWRLLRALRTAERATARRSEARASILAGRYAKARTLLAKTARGPEANVDDAVEYGESFLEEGQPSEGIAHLEESRSELGDDPRILLALARCCRATGDHAKAAAALELAVSALPASVTLQSLLRDCFVDLGWWARAEVAQQRLVDLRPEDGPERQRLIDIRMKCAEGADVADRDAALRGVLAMDPSWPAAAAGRADMLAGQGRLRAAVRVVYRAAKRRPAEETLATLDRLLETHDIKRLLRLYGRLRRRHPASHELALHYAALMLRLGRDAEAESTLGELEGASGREGAIVERMKAEMLEKRSDLAGATSALRRALDRSLESTGD